ncbi:SDR family oxidoreductase [Mobilicoccus caccae]|uniref:SDR family oxidoreductase n=1 Tax=Mobilicoccus caccae TaxID=1859295 RepID=UPI0024E09A92|nr:SDR family oxidoreductase [Mobilicoccus caccae]
MTDKTRVDDTTSGVPGRGASRSGGQPLAGRVALVAGATRGAGRAIAMALGGAGATVYCSGRSGGGARSDYDRPETLEETAALVTEAGGTALVSVTDHLEPEEVSALVSRIHREQGRLDILVNDIGGEAYVRFGVPLWEYPLEEGLRLMRAALLSHLITARAALGLLVRHPGGLVVEITDGTREFNRDRFRDTVFLDLTKTGVDRLAFAEGHELAEHGGTAVSVTPGWLRSEMMLEAFGVTENDWFDASRAAQEPGSPPAAFVISETPHMLARGIAALAADPGRARWNTRSVSSFELAEHYDLTDVDGSRPDTWRYMREVVETGTAADVTDYR